MTEAALFNATGSSVDNWDPVLISLVRRAMFLIAYDICGVQLMTEHNWSYLRYEVKIRIWFKLNEALFNEADTDFSARDARW